MTAPTLEAALTEAQKNDRICPLPQKWQEIYEMLPDKRRQGGGWEPALPLILAAWHTTPYLLKMLRVREHLEWAAEHDCLGQVYEFLCSLPEEDWLHKGEIG